MIAHRTGDKPLVSSWYVCLEPRYTVGPQSSFLTGDFMSKDGRGRKEHQLKVLLRENAEAKKAFAKLVDSLGKMQSIASSLINEGLKVGKESITIESISIPTLALIIKENGRSMRKGRPAASGSTVWKNKPQAIQAVCNVLRDHGLHKGRDYLLNNGITYLNEDGEEEHFAFSANGKKLLSITTLSKVAKENEIKFMVGPRKSRVKSLVTIEEQEEMKKKILSSKKKNSDEDEIVDEVEDENEDEVEDEIVDEVDEDDEDELESEESEEDDEEDEEDEEELDEDEDEEELDDDEEELDEDEEDDEEELDDDEEDFDDEIEDFEDEDEED